MDPYTHAKNSAKRFGGKPEDYLEIHQFMDSSKSHMADIRHRLLLHHSFGVDLATRICGDIALVSSGEGGKERYVHTGCLTNSDGKVVYVRDVAEQHIREDTLEIPSVAEAFALIEPHLAQPVIGMFKVLLRKFKASLSKASDGDEEVISGNRPE